MSQTVPVPVADECEHTGCTDNPDVAFVVTGEYGKDGVAVYCHQHIDEWVGESENHTAITDVHNTEVNHESD